MATYPDDPLRIKVARSNWGAGLQILITDGRHPTTKNLGIAEPLTIKYIEEGAFIEPTTEISLQAGQELMDNLWDCGLRPSEGSGSAGAMLATQKHLEDMRNIVEKFTKVKFNQK